VKDFVATFRANGIRVGFYCSGPDWFKAKDYMSFNYRSESGGNSSLPPIPGRLDLDMNWDPTKIKPMPAEVRARIQQECRQQLTELLTRYGKVDVLWFDGGSGSDITLEEIRKLQPGTVINNRGGLAEKKGGPKFNGDLFTVEHGDQPSRPPGCWEQLRIWNSPTRGYMKQNEEACASTASILKSLARTKAWGGAVMANCGPRPDGTMPPPFYQGMSAVRDWMKANGESIVGAGPAPLDMQSNVPVTTRGETWYLHPVSGSKGKLTAKSGSAPASIKSVRLVRTGEPLEFRWADETLEIAFPEPAQNAPHEVVAVTLEDPRQEH
jgi:alpha-L-fucosidase